MNDKVNALVLKINDYKENDLIMECISSDRSFLSLVGKGSKKVNGKNHFYNLCLYEFIIDYKDNKTMFTIHNSKLIKNYYDDNDLKLTAFKNILVELTLKSKGLYEIDMFDNLLFVFNNINKDNMFLLGSLYLSYILKVSGLSPVVDKCVICGNSKVVSISNTLGGFVCAKHSNNYSFNVNTLKKFRLINKAEFINYDAIKDIEYCFEDFNILISFYMHNADISLKSFKMYKELFY